MNINFRNIYLLLKEWFDERTPEYENFDSWRNQTYRELESGNGGLSFLRFTIKVYPKLEL